MIKNLLEKLKKALNKQVTLNDNNNQKRLAALLALVALLSVFPSNKKSNNSVDNLEDITLEELTDDIPVDEVAEDEQKTDESLALKDALNTIKKLYRPNTNLKIDLDLITPSDSVDEEILNTEQSEVNEAVENTETAGIAEPKEEEIIPATPSIPNEEEPKENPDLEIPNIPIPDTGDYLSLVEKEIVVRYKFELADDTRWKKVVCTLMGEEGTKYNHMYEAVSCLLNRYDCYEKGRKYTNVYDLLITSGEFTAYGGEHYQEYYVLSMDKLKTYASYEAIIDCLFSETPNHNFLQFRDGGRPGQGVKLSEGGDRFFCPVAEDDYKPMEERRYYQKVVEVLSNENHELYDLFSRISEEDMPSIKYYNDQNKVEVPEESTPIIEEINDLETESTDVEILDTDSEIEVTDDAISETNSLEETNNIELENTPQRILVRR